MMLRSLVATVVLASFPAAAAQEDGDPPGHACWDLGDEDALSCYRAHADWAWDGADEALVPPLRLVRTRPERGGFGAAAGALDAHRAAYADADEHCRLTAAWEPEGADATRRAWVEQACRMEAGHARGDQLRDVTDLLSDETVVIVSVAWPYAPASACALDDLDEALRCEGARHEREAARVDALYAAGPDTAAARAAWRDHAAAACGFAGMVTRGASGLTERLAVARCLADAEASRAAELERFSR